MIHRQNVRHFLNFLHHFNRQRQHVMIIPHITTINIFHGNPHLLQLYLIKGRIHDNIIIILHFIFILQLLPVHVKYGILHFQNIPRNPDASLDVILPLIYRTGDNLVLPPNLFTSDRPGLLRGYTQSLLLCHIPNSSLLSPDLRIVIRVFPSDDYRIPRREVKHDNIFTFNLSQPGNPFVRPLNQV